MALRFAVTSFVDTEPYMLVFAGVGADTLLSFPAFAAAETVEDVGIDGDILAATWGTSTTVTGVR